MSKLEDTEYSANVAFLLATIIIKKLWKENNEPVRNITSETLDTYLPQIKEYHPRIEILIDEVKEICDYQFTKNKKPLKKIQTTIEYEDLMKMFDPMIQ